jgi:hypothetical protein
MIINLKHNFYIEVDERNYTLKRTYTNKKTGETATRTHGYYGSLESAIGNYIKFAALDVNDRYTMELFEYVEQVKAVCRETIEVLTKGGAE